MEKERQIENDEINKHNPTNSAPDERCLHCGFMHIEHDTGEPCQTYDCGLVVQGFQPA